VPPLPTVIGKAVAVTVIAVPDGKLLRGDPGAHVCELLVVLA
jgi:hypothetical protein